MVKTLLRDGKLLVNFEQRDNRANLHFERLTLVATWLGLPDLANKTS